VDNAIRKKLKGSVATDPQVHSEIVGDLSGSVLVAGAVKSPGRFSSLQGPLTILDAVNMAGGPVLEPHLINVVVRNGKNAFSINYDDVLSGKNRQVSPRSEIILERARQRFVAMGSVKDPGLKDLPSRNPSLLEVLGSVGGLDEQKADPQGVFVFRINPEPKDGEPTAEVFKLDMRKPESIFLARAFQVFPDDAVYVTNAPVYEWQKIISPIVQTLMLGRTISRF
jgi:polysaccharide export outer membrane protein